MTDETFLKGQCLCGAVQIGAQPVDDTVRACHCDMCRRHTSGAFISLSVDQDTLKVTGPVTLYRSSEWAERAFCGTCGSTLWYATLQDGVRNLSAGLFENAAGGTLAKEFFANRCPSGYGFAGDHRRLSSEETEALFGGGSS